MNLTLVLNLYFIKLLFFLRAVTSPMLPPSFCLLEMKDVVNATLYLLSDKSDMINGTTLPIDGGFLASH